MLHPTIKELTKDKYNRYELALATAKCARMLTDEYVKQREEAEKSMTGNKESDRNLMNSIDKDLKDEKAIKNAITRFHDGRYEIYREEKIAAEVEQTAEELIEDLYSVAEEGRSHKPRGGIFSRFVPNTASQGLTLLRRSSTKIIKNIHAGRCCAALREQKFLQTRKIFDGI